MDGSSDGYTTFADVAPFMSYAYGLYPKFSPTKFVMSIVLTVCTPYILLNNTYRSLNMMGWFIDQLSMAK